MNIGCISIAVHQVENVPSLFTGCATLRLFLTGLLCSSPGSQGKREADGSSHASQHAAQLVSTIKRRKSQRALAVLAHGPGGGAIEGPPLIHRDHHSVHGGLEYFACVLKPCTAPAAPAKISIFQNFISRFQRHSQPGMREFIASLTFQVFQGMCRLKEEGTKEKGTRMWERQLDSVV